MIPKDGSDDFGWPHVAKFIKLIFDGDQFSDFVKESCCRFIIRFFTERYSKSNEESNQVEAPTKGKKKGKKQPSKKIQKETPVTDFATEKIEEDNGVFLCLVEPLIKIIKKDDTA